MIFYLPLNPETLKSVIEKGRLPDQLSDWSFISKLECFQDKKELFAEYAEHKNQLFVLECDCRTRFTFKDGINVEWIQKVIVGTEQAKNLALKLLKGFSTNIIHDASVYPQQISPQRPATIVGFFQRDVSDQPRSVLPVRYVQNGDIFESRCHAIINTINCEGVMGKGLALDFKRKYPEMFKDYQRRCNDKEVKPGRPFIYQAQNKIIVNFPTKNEWRKGSQLQWIQDGLTYLADHCREWGIKSLAIPPLGCGLGGLDWNKVYPLIREHLDPLGIRIEIYSNLPQPVYPPKVSSSRLGKHRGDVLESDAKQVNHHGASGNSNG